MDFHLGELELISSDGNWNIHQQACWYFNATQRGQIKNITE